MKTVSIRTLRFVGLALSLILITAWGSLSAESKCHGLSKGQCEADSDCTWVSGYQKKDGKNVEAYCRAKPGKGDGEHSADHHKKKEDGDTVKKSDSKKDHDEEVESKKGKKSKKEKEEDDDEDSKKSKKDKKSKKENESDKEDKKSKKSKHKKED